MAAAPQSTTTQNLREFRQPPPARLSRGGLDAGLLAGIVVATVALVAGIAVTGVGAHYFFQPTGALIVVGGTFGVMLITTPLPALLYALRRTLGLFSTEASPHREALIEEIVWYARAVRIKGMLAIEPAIDRVSHSFLRDALLFAMDAKDRTLLQSALENRIRLCERQTETAAKVLEVAGGFAPTIGVMGTVVGLIDVLRQFSSLAAIASGVGAAFTSTIYGLALANLVLLPAAHRLRARAAEIFDLQELMAEGTLCLFDGMHPMLVRQRLESFLNAAPVRDRSLPVLESAS
jgi:chemotaxis protein MotA